MRSFTEACVVGAVLLIAAGAQDSKIPMTKGVSVQMATAGHPVEMKAADQPNAPVVAITAEGKIYLGASAADLGALSNLSQGTVFVKADARAPYQKLLTVLDALRGKSIVLLTAPPDNASKRGYVSPYGITLAVSH